MAFPLIELYQRCSDLFYAVIDPMDAVDVVYLSSTNRLMRNLLWNGQYRNIWLERYSRDLTRVRIPPGTVQTLCIDYCRTIGRLGESPHIKHILAHGFESRITISRIEPCTHDMLCAIMAHEDIFFLLVEKCISNFLDPYDQYYIVDNAAMAAASVRILEYLRDKGFNFHRQPNCMDFAAENNRYDMVKFFLDHGFQANYDSNYAFNYSVREDYLAIARLLLDYGADLRNKDDRCLRSQAKSIEMVRLLYSRYPPMPDEFFQAMASKNPYLQRHLEEIGKSK